MLIYFDSYDFLIGICLLAILLPILWWRKRSSAYLVFFSIFWVYLLFVVRIVIFPIAINLNADIGRGIPVINLIPFYVRYCSTFTKYCVIEVAGNIILTIPFGFGINFLAHTKPRIIFWLAVGIGFGFEFSQLIISLMFRSGFRAIDINDAILNAVGVLLGYAFFRGFASVYLKIIAYSEIKHKWLFSDIYDIAFQARIYKKSKNA